MTSYYSILSNTFTSNQGSSQIQTGPLLERPETYISRLNYENMVMMYTHKAIKFKNNRVESYLNGIDQNFAVLYLDQIGDEGFVLEQHLQKTTNQLKPPWIFILGKLRPFHPFLESFHDGMIETWLRDPEMTYNYDLIIIGEGPGSLSAAKAAITYGRRVCFCILGDPKRLPLPEKLFILLKANINTNKSPKKRLKKASKYCTKISKRTWQETIKALRELGIHMTQNSVTFKNSHTIQLGTQNRLITGLNFLLTCDRQTVSQDEGRTVTIEEFLGKSRRSIGNTLVLGNSLPAVEATMILHFLGVPAVTLMYPGRILQPLDQECVQKTLICLVKAGIRVESCIVSHISKESAKETKEVRGIRADTGEKFKEEFKTVVDASDKGFNYKSLNLVDIGVEVKNSFVVCNERGQTSMKNIYAIGGIVFGRPLQTTETESAGHFLIERLFGMQTKLMDNSYNPTVVIGIVEYGSVGLSEEDAVEKHGTENVVVYKSSYKGFDHVLDSNLEENFVKLVCVKPGERVVGVHVMAADVEPMLFGFSLALRKLLTKAELDASMSVDLSNIFMTTNLCRKLQ